MSAADAIRGVAAQAAAGKEVDSNSVDILSTGNEMSPATADSETEVRAEDSTVEDSLPGEHGDAPKDSSDAKQPVAKDAKQANQPTPEREVITVTDEKGRRRKVEIDYSNRERIRKAFEMEAGARKWQAERDQASQKEKAVTGKLGEIESNWNLLEKAFSQGGVEGVVDLLEGRKGAYQDTMKKSWERQKFLESASPEEIKALNAQEAFEHQRRENERIRKENEDFKKQITSERETAELRSLESRVHPVFNKYRFADKLGDETDEHMFDEMLWNTALKRLEPYEEKGLDLSPELVEKEFAAVAKSLRSRIGVQAEKRASRTVEQKKQEATENVQAKVMSGYKTGGSAKEARDLIQSGNLTGLLKQWGKYGSLFNGKK